MSVSAARGKLPEVIESARREAVFLQRHGKAAAVLISPEQYDRLMEAFEEREDAHAFDDAMNEEGPNIPWSEVKADLGWE